MYSPLDALIRFSYPGVLAQDERQSRDSDVASLLIKEGLSGRTLVGKVIKRAKR